ncbi:hypothetical protein CAOG_03569 [Capsaspora owczarzaki ATCC 30864]|uniref:C2H2-type domain-containing protein n=1 Tax=Capsaspora owczarzaki (strain ATCC 30864) TaxID=595528 RepID=A0A0D2X2J1_CAPO3|nr:hypothetical protein CAOG_03569 [Capsaspora owczarzaki ATCC 30864]KJE92649.1 hypothetical protein CAOG_003569 [Capsaspora owczarzaki ATCC 30864]|eukprot:XP_004363297.1 hypothetical protein CAOG_03569 [Capsaspora owczarzaki ATCC 30864]
MWAAVVQNAQAVWPETQPLSLDSISRHPCEQRFGSAGLLFEHLREVHVGLRLDKTFQGQCQWANCSRADQQFGKPYDLVSHIQVHVNVRPFECICGARSKRQSDLRKHLEGCCQGTDFKWTKATSGLFLARKGFSDDAITRILQLVQDPEDILRVTDAQLLEVQMDAQTCRLVLDGTPVEFRNNTAK